MPEISTKKVTTSPRIKRKSGEQQNDFRKIIQNIASDLFAIQGYHAVSIRKIALRAGCSPMTLYTYFESKHALLRALWADIFTEAIVICASASELGKTPEQKLSNHINAWIDFWIRRPDAYKVVFMNSDVVRLPSEKYFVQEPVAMRLLENVAHLISQTTGMTFHSIEDERVVQLWLSQTIGYVHLCVTAPELGWCEDAILRTKIVDFLTLLLKRHLPYPDRFTSNT